MSLEWAVAHFGYAAVLVGTFFEGEIILILAGFAAHRGYLDLPLVMIAAFLGSFAGDQLYFFLGRRKGRAFLDRHNGWRDRIERFSGMMTKYGTIIILVFRFLYGLRTVAPFAIGLSDISAGKFFALNLVSALVWAVALGVLGYLFGHAMEVILEDVKRYELVLMAGLAAIAVMVLTIRHIRNRKRAA